MSKKFIIIAIVAGGIVSVMFILFIIFCIFAAIMIPQFVKLSDKMPVANNITMSLNSAEAIYIAQNKKVPKKFSDFVCLTSSPKGKQVLTLMNLREVIKEPDTEEDLKGNTFEMTFKNAPLRVNYSLEGRRVIAVHTYK